MTGGSNLDLPLDCYSADGRRHSLENDVCTSYDIVLCISTYSATAPLTAWAKKHGFRGATLHGLNDIILATGLSVDYDQVSAQAERLRQGMTNAERVEIEFEVAGQRMQLNLDLGNQEAQKSHGLCRGKPDIANLPAGEIYFVPESANGNFPLNFEDGTIAALKVENGAVVRATLIEGSPAVVDEYNEKLVSDPATGKIGELGFGTQELPASGRDIQDEKILGTLHVATGRSDHLGGDVVPLSFNNPQNATHDDILFSGTKTPKIKVPEVRMYRNGTQEVLIRNYEPAAYMQSLLGR
jgi:aminopeptidase